MDSLPRPSRASPRELAAAQFQLEYLEAMRKSAYWPGLGTGEPSGSGSGSGSGTGTGAGTRKVKELPRFTDRYRPEEQDPPSLKKVRLQREVFPREVWRVYMEGETRREAVRAREKARKMNLANFDWDAFDAAGGGAGADGAVGEGEDGEGDLSGAGGEEELDAYEDEEDDDYAQNYFDNGEDDGGGDDGDGGGGGDYD